MSRYAACAHLEQLAVLVARDLQAVEQRELELEALGVRLKQRLVLLDQLDDHLQHLHLILAHRVDAADHARPDDLDDLLACTTTRLKPSHDAEKHAELHVA